MLLLVGDAYSVGRFLLTDILRACPEETELSADARLRVQPQYGSVATGLDGSVRPI
jgi:hypothetical protein